MKYRFLSHNYEKAQILPLVVLGLAALIGFAALITDGAAIISNRRTAQAAADAGAMAGAWELCYGTQANAIPAAENYAVENGALSPPIVSLPSDYEVTVTATVEHESFFAKIFGMDTLRATADATAGCYGVSGSGVLPLTWYCHDPAEVLANDPENPNYEWIEDWMDEYGATCLVQPIRWSDIRDNIHPGGTISLEDAGDGNIYDYYYEEVWENKTKSKSFVRDVTEDNTDDGVDNPVDLKRPPDQLYIIGDSEKICIEDKDVFGYTDEQLETNGIVCDLDGDGKLDIQVGGNRGWVYLTDDTTNIGDWVDDGPRPDVRLEPHVWLEGKPGADVAVFNKMLDPTVGDPFPGQVIKVPVFDAFCDTRVETLEECREKAGHPAEGCGDCCDETIFEETNNTDIYHIVTFAHLYVTCISTEANCPGRIYAESYSDDIFNDNRVLEGFFVSGYLDSAETDLGCDGYNCIISLSD